MTEYKIQRHRNKNYTTINNVPLRDRNLSLRAKGFLIMIMGLPDTWDFSIKGISTCIKESEGIVRLIVTELKEAGYCKCIRECNKGKVVKWRYVFTDERGNFDDEETSANDDQLNDLPLVEKTTCGKSQSGINKENIYNNKENNKEKTLLTESEKGADAPTPSNIFEVKEQEAFYKGMKERYPYVAKMENPLTYDEYLKLLTKYSRIKIHMNLRAMNNWKGLTKRRNAFDTLDDWCMKDNHEYKESDLL